MIKYITIFGIRIPIKMVELEDAEAQFSAKDGEYIIRIDPTSKWSQQRLLLHESLHASLEISGMNEVFEKNEIEEAVVTCIENGLWPLIEKGIFNAKE